MVECLRLPLEGHNEIGIFSGDLVPKRVNAITIQWVFAWMTGSDGCITKAKLRRGW